MGGGEQGFARLGRTMLRRLCSARPSAAQMGRNCWVTVGAFLADAKPDTYYARWPWQAAHPPLRIYQQGGQAVRLPSSLEQMPLEALLHWSDILGALQDVRAAVLVCRRLSREDFNQQVLRWLWLDEIRRGEQQCRQSAIDIEIERSEDQGGAQALTLHYQGRIFYIDLPQAGEFQASNALVAAGLAIATGDVAGRVLPALQGLKGVKGRLEIIGVHTPEFAFEHVASNVRAAVRRLGVTWPVSTSKALK